MNPPLDAIARRAARRRVRWQATRPRPRDSHRATILTTTRTVCLTATISTRCRSRCSLASVELAVPATRGALGTGDWHAIDADWGEVTQLARRYGSDGRVASRHHRAMQPRTRLHVPFHRRLHRELRVGKGRVVGLPRSTTMRRDPVLPAWRGGQQAAPRRHATGRLHASPPPSRNLFVNNTRGGQRAQIDRPQGIRSNRSKLLRLLLLLAVVCLPPPFPSLAVAAPTPLRRTREKKDGREVPRGLVICVQTQHS